jgi:hypothetical protein
MSASSQQPLGSTNGFGAPVDGMHFAPWLDSFQRRDVFLHDHDLCTRQLLDQGSTLLMIAVAACVPSRIRTSVNLNPSCVTDFSIIRNVPLVRAVEENVPLVRTHVASQDRAGRVGLPANRDDRLIGRLTCLSDSRARMQR